MTRLADKPLPTVTEGPMLPQVDPITRLPVVVLFPHSRCNCRCLMCDIWRATGKNEISVEEIEQWAGEWAEIGVRRIALSGGEALMHSQIEAVCERLHALGIGITVMTTGLLLERHASWLPRYVDDVVVSLDGPEEAHDRIRNVPRAFARLRDGVSALRDSSDHIAISGRCVVQKANYRWLRQVVRAAEEIGLDRISFLAADVSSEAFNRPGRWNEERVEEVGLGVEDLPCLQAELDRLEKECGGQFESGFIAESPQKLRSRLLDHFAAACGVCDFPSVRCNAPWVSCVVEADGTVRPCFFQPAYGNLREAGDLLTVMNSARATAFRQQLDVRTDPICRRCVCTLALEASDACPL